MTKTEIENRLEPQSLFMAGKAYRAFSEEHGDSSSGREAYCALGSAQFDAPYRLMSVVEYLLRMNEIVSPDNKEAAQRVWREKNQQGIFNNNFFTSNVFLQHPDGRLKIAHEPNLVQKIENLSMLYYGAIPLPVNYYELLQSPQEFKRGGEALRQRSLLLYEEMPALDELMPQELADNNGEVEKRILSALCRGNISLFDNLYKLQDYDINYKLIFDLRTIFQGPRHIAVMNPVTINSRGKFIAVKSGNLDDMGKTIGIVDVQYARAEDQIDYIASYKDGTKSLCTISLREMLFYINTGLRQLPDATFDMSEYIGNICNLDSIGGIRTLRDGFNY